MYIAIWISGHIADPYKCATPLISVQQLNEASSGSERMCARMFTHA